MHAENIGQERPGHPPVWRPLSLFLIYGFAGPLITFVSEKNHAPEAIKQFFELKPYAIPILIAAYLVNPGLFTSECWKFPAISWIGVSLLAASQLVIRITLHPEQPPPYRIIASLLIAPIIEEVLRAGLICAIQERTRTALTILITSGIFAAFHELFWIALLTQTLLSITFVYTKRSLPACILAHFIGNLVATVH